MMRSVILMLMIITMMLVSSSPMKAALMLTSMSVIMSMLVLSKTCSVFLMSAVIISFSSGMMILVTYSSTLVSQETENFKISWLVKTAAIIMVMWFTPNQTMVSMVYKSVASTETTIFMVTMMGFLMLTMKTLNDYIMDKSLPMKQTF